MHAPLGKYNQRETAVWVPLTDASVSRFSGDLRRGDQRSLPVLQNGFGGASRFYVGQLAREAPFEGPLDVRDQSECAVCVGYRVQPIELLS